MRKMSSRKSPLDNLVEAGVLKTHVADPKELQVHISIARERLKDASLAGLSPSGKFTSLYDAAHALCMAAIKIYGYRPSDERGHRQGLFNVIDQVTPAAASAKNILLQAHGVRNVMQYDGTMQDFSEGEMEALEKETSNLLEEVEYNVKAYIKSKA